MIAYDKRIYYNRQREPFYDPEWEEAERSDEKPVYWWVDDNSGCRNVRKYKPSVAAVVAKRTHWKFTRVSECE